MPRLGPSSIAVCAPWVPHYGRSQHIAANLRMFYPDSHAVVCILYLALFGFQQRGKPRSKVPPPMWMSCYAGAYPLSSTAITKLRSRTTGRLSPFTRTWRRRKPTWARRLPPRETSTPPLKQDIRAMAVGAGQDRCAQKPGAGLLQKRRHGACPTEFEAVHAARPRDIKAAVLLGYTYIKLDKGAEAAALLAPAGARARSPTWISNMCWAMPDPVRKGQQREFRAWRKRRSATHSVDAYVIAGTGAHASQRVPQARADFDTALGIEPVVSRPLHHGRTGSRCDGRYGCVCARLRGCPARRIQRTPPPICTWE
jgi:hypothetical protein